MDVNKSIIEGMILENTFNDILNEKALNQEENNTEVKAVAKKMATEVMKKIKEEKMQYLKVSGPNKDDNTFSVENLAKLAEKLNNANYNKTIEGIEKSIISIVKSVAKEIARPAGYTVDVFNSDIGGKDAYITFGVYKKKKL